jgi:hypothetical protein
VVNVLIGQGNVLQDRQKALFPVQALNQVMQGMQSHQRMQRPAVMARRQV